VPARSKHRDALVRSAAVLFRRQGYAGTGTNDILALSKAPRGSLYHYFPRGKQQIAAEAVRYAGGLVTETLGSLLSQHGPASAIRRYGRLLAGWMHDSKFRDGCPISTTLLEISPDSVEVTEAGLEAFTAWTDMIGHALRSEGVSAARARRLAAAAIAGIEGSLIMSRVTQSTAPILDATREVADMIDAAIATVADD
jgi:TetR/AcrR family transcriptional regulator, lmrAB and yxaGH operons repressor